MGGAKEHLPVAFLRECLDYDPGTGSLTWKSRPIEHFPTAQGWKIFEKMYAGKPAGAIGVGGYLELSILRRRLLGHRLIWALVNNIEISDLPEEIDHVDLNRANNSLINLRPANKATNAYNTGLRSNNTSGFKGVDFYKPGGTWRARIKVGAVVKYLGYFRTPEEAAEARANAQHLHGEYARLTANDNITSAAA